MDQCCQMRQEASYTAPLARRAIPGIDDAVIAEAALARQVVLVGIPAFAQWDVMRRDIDAAGPLGRGARWWLAKAGKQLTLVNGSATWWPGYEGLDPTINGFGWPVPVVSVPRSYQQTPTGVGIAGTSVILHEWGHTLDILLDGAFGNNPGWPASRQGPWVAAHARQDWSRLGDLFRVSPFEAFAEGYAVWRMVKTGGFNARLPGGVDFTPIMDYWDWVDRKANWGGA